MTISSGNKQGTLTPVNENISNLEVKDALFAMAPWNIVIAQEMLMMLEVSLSPV
jgi:hypothetical protein